MASTNRRVTVIIDTDPGIDDMLAILLALASPELEILAFVVSFGNTDVDSSFLNIIKAYRVLERHFTDYPEDRSRFPNFDPGRKPILARGSSLPLQGELHSAQYFHGRDGLGNIDERHPDFNVEPSEYAVDHPYLQILDKPGTDVVLDILRSQPARSVSYIALGPLTTLARALRADPTLVRDRIGRITCMGGALDVPGNTSPVAEFNFFADPFAVHELLTPADGVPGIPLERFVLLPLDITTPHELRFAQYIQAVDGAFQNTAAPSRAGDKRPLVHFTSAWLERAREVMLEFGKDALELHDPVAVWCAIANPPSEREVPVGGLPSLTEGWKAVKRTFQVERVGEITRGMLVVDRRDDAGAYAPGDNRAHVQSELERFSADHGEFESTAIPAPVEVEGDAEAHQLQHGSGVACVVRTPGVDSLVGLLLQRIWGITLAKSG